MAYPTAVVYAPKVFDLLTCECDSVSFSLASCHYTSAAPFLMMLDQGQVATKEVGSLIAPIRSAARIEGRSALAHTALASRSLGCGSSSWHFAAGGITDDSRTNLPDSGL